MSRHTEGPWQSVSDDHDPYTIIGGIDGPDDGRMHFTEVCTVNETAADASGNARLIAAAPDMLKALRGASHALRSYQYGNTSTEFAAGQADRIDALIAKAEGRS